MVETLQPRTTFPISRVLADPTDTGSYFIRGLVKNATTGTLISTVTLANISGRLYIGSFTTPADPSGQGLFITITTQVFTDAGFTTVGPYNDEHSTFLIYDRFKIAQQVAAQSTGGEDIDYKKIEKIFRAVLKEVIKEPKPIDLSELTTALASMRGDLTILKNKEQAEPDFGPLYTHLSATTDLVKNHITEKTDTLKKALTTKPVDLSPVVQGINELKNRDTASHIDTLRSLVSELLTALGTEWPNIIDKVKEMSAYFNQLALQNPAQGTKPTAQPSLSLNRAGKLIQR